VLIEYTDTLGRRTRLAVDGDAWVRQERRRGRWWTAERHPIDDLRTVLGNTVTEEIDDEQALAEVNAGP